MAKQLLKERFQQLAGIKPLYTEGYGDRHKDPWHGWSGEDMTPGEKKEYDILINYLKQPDLIAQNMKGHIHDTPIDVVKRYAKDAYNSDLGDRGNNQMWTDRINISNLWLKQNGESHGVAY